MGKYFNKYNIYKTSLQGKNLIGPADSLNSNIISGITDSKNKFNQTNTSKWNELAKPSVSNIITSIQTSLTDLSTFVSSNLVVVCSKAEQLYEKVVEIIDKDEKLDNLEERIKNTPNTKSVIENGKTITIDNPDYIALNNSINELEAVLSTLSESADALINDIKDFDGLDVIITNNNIDTDFSNYFDSLDITNIEIVTNDDDQLMSTILTFSNGKKLQIYRQGSYSTINIGNNKVNLKANGCSYFAGASVLQFLTQDSRLNFENIAKSLGGGNYDGITKLFNGTRSITINGVKYYVSSDISEKITPRDNSLTKEENKAKTLETWRNTFQNGGAVIFNTGKTAISGTINGKKMGASQITNITGIKSEGGHMLAMYGEDKDGKVIFSDSVYIENKDTYYTKNITLEELYDIYFAGQTGTKVEDGERKEIYEYYQTVTHAKLVPEEDFIQAKN